ncbi:hypothetical protein Gohar_017494 [Gossypium harknessii]|uniref:DUF4283 domain-containing protein n=1 Tax=Gossypium harknessii TaxID=34285 RepID=A0A7J9G6H0_9ROSI|nr:hypothetical protein [Gossypium harknessii]
MVVPLIFVDFWVQIHNLPFGLISEVMGRQFGNFIGTFLEYDMKAMGRGFRGYMRVSVQVDIRDPPKRLGHFEGFCLVHIVHRRRELPLEWDLPIKAAP